MLYWSVGSSGDTARYIHRTTLDGAAGDNVQRFVDVTDNSVTSAAAAAVQDIVVDVRARRFAHHMIPLLLLLILAVITHAGYIVDTTAYVFLVFIFCLTSILFRICSGWPNALPK